MRELRSARSISSASWSAWATSSMLYGFTRSASVIVSAAPASRERISTPGSPTWLTTYSLATRFMPSRSGVTSAISASR